MKNKIFNTANVLIMIFVILITFYPFYYCFVLSFNNGLDAEMGGIYLWPRKFSLDNYIFIFSEKLLFIGFRNSVLRTVLGTAATILVTSLAAYALSKRNLIGKRFYNIFFLLTMYFSGGLIPTYLVVKKIGLIDRFLVYILPGIFVYYLALLFIAYFKSIPDSIEESARIDGSGEFRIFFRLIIPMSAPIFATTALFAGVGQWNAWFDTMIYTRSSQLETLQHLLVRIIKEAEAIINAQKNAAASGGGFKSVEVTPFTIKITTMIVTSFPIIVVYPFLQKYFIKGIMLGAVKG